MDGFIIESPRLGMRRLCPEDHGALLEILGDPRVMYAWEHGFTPQEVTDWIDNSIRRYLEDGYGYFALIEKATGNLIGTMGPLKEDIGGESVTGIGYILGRNSWGKGYAAEGARACAQYVFTVLGKDRIICDIRPQNTASIGVAEKIGMKPVGEFVKRYRGKDMPHVIFELKRR